MASEHTTGPKLGHARDCSPERDVLGHTMHDRPSQVHQRPSPSRSGEYQRVWEERRGTPTSGSAPLTASTLKAALGAANDGVLLIDRAGHVVFANPAAERALQEPNLQGRHCADIWRLDREKFCAIWREVQRAGRWTGRLSRQQYLSHVPHMPLDTASNDPGGARTARSELRETRMTLTRVVDESSAEHFCVVLPARESAQHTQDAQHTRNIIEALDSESPSRSRNARLEGRLDGITALQRVASEIAHDFNNQIAVVLNYTFVLLRQIPDESPLKAHVTEMQAAAWRASRVAQAIRRALLQSPALQTPE